MSTLTIPDLPLISEVDLQIRAVCREEERIGAKISLETLHPWKLHHICVHYLRHAWFTEYDKKKKRRPDDYIAVNEQFVALVEKQYPYLLYAAQMQLLNKKRKMESIGVSHIDKQLNDIIDAFGYGFYIHSWRWYGCPGPFSERSKVPLGLDRKVLTHIHLAHSDLCKTSSSEYVRCCKIWLNDNIEWLASWIQEPVRLPRAKVANMN